jgi:hypothetical protein
LLYWQASEAESGKAPDTNAKPKSTYKTRPGSSSQTSLNAFDHDVDSNTTKRERDDAAMSPIHRPSTPLGLDINNNTSRCPFSKRTFAYYPQLIFLGLLVQIAFFFVQFDIYRRNGLPGFVARWPVIYALTAPSTTGIYMIGVLKLAPARWPALSEGRFVEVGEMCVYGVWVVWSLGIWWVVRGW